MAKNVGKIFETQWKNSTPAYALIYRLPDAATSFGSNVNIRFSRKNPFDYLMFDSAHHLLYALELKSVSGKSISFERSKEDHGVIHYWQIDGLAEWNQFDGVVCGFVIEFRDLEQTIFIDIDSFKQLAQLIPKKSFTLNDLQTYEIPFYTIIQTKRRTRFSYDIDLFLQQQAVIYGGKDNGE